MDEYIGFKEITLSDEDLASFYQNDCTDQFDCLQNQYLLLRDAAGGDVGIFRKNGAKMVKVPFKQIRGKFLGTIKPRNVQQQMAIDLLYHADTTVKILTGKFGTGKDLLMCAAAIDMLERGKYDKIVYVRNNIEVKNSKPIGFLPGSNDEKLLPYAMPLADHLGGADGLNLMVSSGKIEIVHLGFIRGRDIKNSIIYCSEAENMTKEHIQLLLGRVGEGSALWINGDFKQCDAEVFQKNSGLMAAVNRLKGHPRFGYVKLLKTERSETAAMADLLD